jgi:hypothetical protein
VAVGGPGLWENDQAHEFLSDVKREGTPALKRVIQGAKQRPSEYLEVDEVVEFLVACHLLASAVQPRESEKGVPEDFVHIASAIAPSSDLIDSSLPILERLADGQPNELAELLDGTVALKPWHELVQRILAHVRRVSALPVSPKIGGA